MQVLLTGHAADWDRRVVVETAPAFAIVGEAVSLVLRVEDIGAAPAGSGSVSLAISLDGTEPLRFDVPLGQSVTLPVTLQRGGVNVLQITTPEVAGELTDRNNQAIVSINGVRDRLRVLLVSGEPYPGERTWRNLLKSDSAVDLVHFTILRPPEKQDFVPVFELSLIAFPTQELFMEKVDEFDLIIFDRYKRRGILPNHYFDNIARYVRDGGALLIASGDDFAGAESLYRSPLREILPVEPTARVIEEGFVPKVSGDRPPPPGDRRPRGARAEADRRRTAPRAGAAGSARSRSRRDGGETVMEGPEGRPLLVLDRQGEGRIAVLLSDQAWLWSRGFEGGGPQLELLRRLAHWLMKEPELEEEVLRGTGEDGAVVIERRTLADSVPPVTATSPSGATSEVALTEIAPGLWQGRIEDAENGVWRLENGDQQRGGRRRPLGAEGVREPGLDRRRPRPARRRHPRRRPAARGRPARRAPRPRGPRRRGPRLDRPRRPRSLPAPRHPPGRPGARLAGLILAAGLAFAAWRDRGAVMAGETPLARRRRRGAAAHQAVELPEPFFSRMAGARSGRSATASA